MKYLLIGVLFLIPQAGHAEGQPFSATVKGWAVNNFAIVNPKGTPTDTSLQYDVNVELNSDRKYKVVSARLRNAKGTVELTASENDMKHEPDGSLLIRFNKYNVYDQKFRNKGPAGKCELDLNASTGDETICKLEITGPGGQVLQSDSISDEFDGPGAVGTTIHLPSISSCTLSARVFEVQFSVTDRNVFSGVIQYYDALGHEIGESDSFISFPGGKSSSNLNNGAGLFVDGRRNVFEVETSRLSFKTSFTGNDIHSFLLILTDGRQYLQEPVPTWDYMAIVKGFPIDFESK